MSHAYWIHSFTRCALALITLCAAHTALAQTTQFVYQGKLTDAGAPASGQYDFQFKLFDTLVVGSGTQQGPTVTVSNLTVADGVFTAQVDFGACAVCFNGSTRFLEVSVKKIADLTFTTLAPRQPVTSNPYAIRSLNATSADGLSVACVNCVTSSQIQSVQGSQVSGVIPVASIPPGSASYIQNTTSPQAASNFNISGNGTVAGTLSANVVNATAQYNIGGNRVLSIGGAGNLFVGPDAGSSNTTGGFNSFLGSGAGLRNTTGSDNSFFGVDAGWGNITGSGNSFFGKFAGASNTGGSSNSFFGQTAGYSNITGAGNSFFGALAGSSNTTGILNSFFGVSAGYSNTTGNYNSFFGVSAGHSNTTAGNNSFFGEGTGQANTTGGSNSFFGVNAGLYNTTGNSNSFFGVLAGSSNTTEDNNTFIGTLSNGEAGITNATAIGANAKVTQSNSLVLGSINGVNGAQADTKVGIGTTAPANRFHVAASFNASAVNPANHVTLIENTSAGTSADVMALKIGRTTSPESSNNFITFFKGDNSTVGSIEGNASGGVVLAGPGSDYAEWLPRLNAGERIEPGEIVGLYGGQITKDTRGAEQVMVVSTGPIVAGNDPGDRARSRYSQVVFIGQVMVKVRGAVQAGDFILASGQGDGVGVAISPACISAEEYAKVVGQAWQASSEPGVKRVRMAVGLIRHDPAVKRLSEQSQKQTAQIAALKQQNSALEKHQAVLDARLIAFEQKLRSLASSKPTSRRGRNASLGRSIQR